MWCKRSMTREEKATPLLMVITPNEKFIRQEKNAQGNFSSAHQWELLKQGVFT